MVQVEGQALRIEARKLEAAIEDDTALRLHLARYGQCFHFQVAQTAACNAGHTLEQRLARWLLLARHRIGSDELPLTHEFLSMMLAVRRAGVTVATGTLQQAKAAAFGSSSAMSKRAWLMADRLFWSIFVAMVPAVTRSTHWLTARSIAAGTQSQCSTTPESDAPMSSATASGGGSLSVWLPSRRLGCMP
jgi:hypothetical protein